MIEKLIQIDKRRNQAIDKQLETSLYSAIMSKTFTENYILPLPSSLAALLFISEKDVQLAYDALLKANILEKDENNYSIRKNILSTASNYTLRAIVESIKLIGLEPALIHIDQVIYADKALKRFQNEFDEDDKVLMVKRIYTGNDHPVVYLEESLSLKYFPGMDKLDLSDFLFYPYLFKTYPDTYTMKRELTMDSLPKDIALALNQNEGVPAIHTISRSYNSSNHLVEYLEIWSIADYFKFKVDVEL
jgi:DNA-binding GntR family transcriptional regulator